MNVRTTPGDDSNDLPDRDDGLTFDRAFGTVVVTASLVSITIGAVYWLSRAGFANPAGPVLRTIGLSLFMIAAPYVLRRASATGPQPEAWFTSYPFLWLVTMLSTAIAGYLLRTEAKPLSIVLAVGGAAAFVVIFTRWLRRGNLLENAAITTGSVAFGLWTSGVVWGRIYKNPLFFENMAVNGMVHHDSLHLAAFANMLRTYGAASTGLDGLPYIPYHWGTAWLFAQWSNVLGISVLDFYQLAFPVLMIPLFFGGLLAVATQVGNLSRRSSGVFDIRNGPRPLVVLLIASVGVIPITAMDAMGVWTSNVVISESYTVAVPVALLLLATTLVFWKGQDSGNRVTDAAFLFIALPIGIIALGYLKISLMVLGLLAALYVGVRHTLYKRPLFAASGGLLLVAVFVTYGQVSLPAHNEGLAPFDFMSGFVPRQWWPFFFLIHLMWTWLYIGLRVRHERVRNLAELWHAIRERRLVDAEVVLVIALAGVAPGLIIHIDGGSAFYFSDVQRWLAVALLIGSAHTLLVHNTTSAAIVSGSGLIEGGEGTKRGPVGGIPIARVLLGLIAIPLAISMASNATRWAAQMIRENTKTRQLVFAASGIAGAVGVAGGSEALPHLANAAALQPSLRRTRNFAVLDQLRSLNDLPISDRRRTALFIAQSDTAYWSILSRQGACTFAPFVAPALAGMAMVDGMPAADCELSRYYGLGSYAPRTRLQTADDASPARLCAKARHSGLDRVMILSFVTARMAVARIDCGLRERRVSDGLLPQRLQTAQK